MYTQTDLARPHVGAGGADAAQNVLDGGRDGAAVRDEHGLALGRPVLCHAAGVPVVAW